MDAALRGLFFLTPGDAMTNSEIHAKAGELVDTFVVRSLANQWGADDWGLGEGNGWNAMIGDAPVLVKTSCSLHGHVLFEHTGRGGEPGWMLGDAEFGVQAAGNNKVAVYSMERAAAYVVARFGHPENLVPQKPQWTKVPERWVSRQDRNGEPVGDAFIYVHAHHLANEGILHFEPVPMLDSVIKLCKTARGVQQPMDVRLAALERLETI